MATYSTEAIVIKSTDFGEADKIVTLFSKHKGKLASIAKGVRKIESRKAASLDLLSQCKVFLAQGRNLDLILETDIINPFATLKTNLELATFGYQVAEMINEFVEEGSPNLSLYKQAIEVLEALDQSSNVEDAEKIMGSYKLKFLSFLGFRPQLNKCANCNNLLIQSGNRFSARIGGVVCGGCARIDTFSRPITIDAIKVLRFLVDNQYDRVSKLNLNGGLRLEVGQQIGYYLEYLLEKDLKSDRLIEEIERLNK